jgi:hypothetical protein
MAFKVKELIVRLKQYNPEARVVLQHYNGTQEDDYEYLYDVGWKYEDNGDTNHKEVVLS